LHRAAALLFCSLGPGVWLGCQGPSLQEDAGATSDAGAMSDAGALPDGELFDGGSDSAAGGDSSNDASDASISTEIDGSADGGGGIGQCNFDPGATVPLGGASAVSMGAAQSCALLSNGRAVCWGDNTDGELGDSTENTTAMAVPVTGQGTFVALSAGGGVVGGANQTCGLLAGGTVQCWGGNLFGGLGNGTTTGSDMPAAVQGLTDVTAISAGFNYTCAVRSDGTVWCWGYFGGMPAPVGSMETTTTPVQVPGISTAIGIAADHVEGAATPCALLSGGSVTCWGTSPGDTSGLAGAVAIGAGAGQACAVLETGAVVCWGTNSHGELGDGPTDGGPTVASSTPVTVQGIVNATAIAVGFHHACALLADQTVTCWGDNSAGETIPNSLPDGGAPPSLAAVPVAVTGLNGVKSIAAGQDDTCALLADGDVQCWGANQTGQLGNGTTTNTSDIGAVLTQTGSSGYAVSPFLVSCLPPVTAVSAAVSYTCAVLSDGTVYCIGYNSSGQLGNGTVSNSPVPTQVIGVSGATSISTAGAYACVVVHDGGVECWGDNTAGELGSDAGTTNSSNDDVISPVATPVPGLSGVVSISAGIQHVCALLSDGTAKCWGDNSCGELGTGSAGPNVSTPTTVTVVDTMAAITAGNDTTCAILNDGGIECWGCASDLPIAESLTPSPVPQYAGATAISMSEVSSCALLAGGAVSCGAVGFGSFGGLVGATQVSVGYAFACATMSDGTAECWGSGSQGQLGNGNGVSNITPSTVTSLSGVTSVSAGFEHACALLSSGQLACWGDNTYGELFVSTTLP
jgi:alpha-tubulin suppressor-like RCC1 family protein